MSMTGRPAIMFPQRQMGRRGMIKKATAGATTRTTKRKSAKPHEEPKPQPPAAAATWTPQDTGPLGNARRKRAGPHDRDDDGTRVPEWLGICS